MEELDDVTIFNELSHLIFDGSVILQVFITQLLFESLYLLLIIIFIFFHDGC
jgi:hypothetical protein